MLIAVEQQLTRTQARVKGMEKEEKKEPEDSLEQGDDEFLNEEDIKVS